MAHLPGNVVYGSVTSFANGQAQVSTPTGVVTLMVSERLAPAFAAALASGAPQVIAVMCPLLGPAVARQIAPLGARAAEILAIAKKCPNGVCSDSITSLALR
jgi:hypothetical protein